MVSATRVAVPCYPYNWVENGKNNTTSVRSPGNLFASLLAPSLAKLNQSVEMLLATSEPDPNITNLPEIQARYDGVADLSCENDFYTHERQEIISYLYPVRVSVLFFVIILIY